MHRYIMRRLLCLCVTYIRDPESEVMKNMEKVVMPELITPVLAEMIAENPEILKTIVDHQPGEEVIIGQDCTLDCGSNPTNVKLVFCNVTIGIDETEKESDNGCSSKGAEEYKGKCHIKVGNEDITQEGMRWVGLPSELVQLKIEVAVLEARSNEIEKILKMIPRQPSNRKMIARCKVDLNAALERLAVKKNELESINRHMQ